MKLLFAAASAAALMAAAPASAQVVGGTQWYGTLGYSHASTNIDFEDLNRDVDLSSGLVTGRVGARFGRHLGVEGEASLGVTEGEESFSSSIGNINFTADIAYKMKSEIGVYGVGFLPVAPNADLFGRLGVGRIDSEIEGTVRSGTVSESFSEDGGSDFVGYGVGGQYFFDARNGVRAEYTRFDLVDDDEDTDQAEFDVFSIAFVRKF
jgi:outer membrane immunogenic protein